MRIAIVSDIHANLPALEAVARDIEASRVDAVWCLGDIVGYGAHPREALEWVLKNASVIVKGNHDHAVATGDVEGFNAIAASSARHHAQLLTPPERTRLHELPERARPRPRDLLVHASPESPLHEYVFPNSARNHLAAWSTSLDADVILMGHTHVPYAARLEPDASGAWSVAGFRDAPTDTREGARPLLALNPGSVGQPRDADPRASYAILDEGERTAQLRRVAYDIDAAALAIRKAGLDPFLGQRLHRGA